MKYFIVICVFIISMSFNYTLSQPAAIVQFYAGYSLPMGALKGTFGNTFSTWTGNGNPDTNTFFMKSGINYGFIVKIPIAKKSPFQITGGIGFNSFGNSVTYDDTTGSADITLKQNHLSIFLGGEYKYFSKKSKFIPFAGAEFMVNFIGGSLNMIYPEQERNFTMNSTTRFGFQFGAGVDYILHQNIGIVVGAKYSFSNLIGKSFKEDIGTKYNLNDDKHTFNGSSYPAKNIQYLQFYGGISFYFGM